MPTRSKKSDLKYAHEDEIETLITKKQSNGKTPVYFYYSRDDEAFFVSETPITKARIKDEFAGHALCAAGYNWDDI